MSIKQPTDNLSTAGKPEPTLEELVDDADQILRQIDRMVHDELSDKTEFVAGWDQLMRQYEEAIVKDQREAEEKKLDQEIGEWMDRIGADIDRLSQLDPLDLEADETVARTLASLHEVDAVMRLRCRHYPDQLAKWEEVMGPVKELEAVFAAAMEAEEAKPGN